MGKEEKVYILKESEIVKKIADYEKSGDYGVARGLLIAASMSGMDISTFRFYHATDDSKNSGKKPVKKKK